MALMHVHYFSDTLGMATQMEVVLPQTGDHQIGLSRAAGEGDIPVLYLLHGKTDNHTTWTRNTNVERYALEKGFAVVMPNAHLSFYADMQMGFEYFTHLSEELPRVVHSFFPQLSTRRERTFIAGNSMGGYGCMLHALTHPERFAGAMCFSGALDIPATRALEARGGGGQPTAWEDIFGDMDAFAGGPYDLKALAERVAAGSGPRPALWMWCGFGDVLYPQNAAFRDHLTALGWDLDYSESDGDHSWTCWERELPRALGWMAEEVR